MPKIRHLLRPLLEPVLGVAFLGAWAAHEANQILSYVPQRTDTFITNPYAVLIAVGFALAVALCRLMPGAAISLTGGLLVLQLIFWPARFSQTSWFAYLALVFVAVGISAYGKTIVRRVALGLSILYALAISALLNVPFLSMSGVTGTINGKGAGSIDVLQGFASWAVVGILVSLAAWYVGSRIRSRTAPRGTSSAGATTEDGERTDAERAGINLGPQAPGRDGVNSIEALSPREREMFLLAARGLSNSEIARTANIGESTVKSHLSSILAKLGLTSRAQIVAHAYESGLLSSWPTNTAPDFSSGGKRP